MKHLWMEVDLSETLYDAGWTEIEKPKGFIKGEIREQPVCNHPTTLPHSEGEWGNVCVAVEDLHLQDAIRFYKEQGRVLSVEVEEVLEG